MTTPNYRALCAAVRELLNALDKVQDWDTTRVGDAMNAVEIALLAASEARPPAATSPQALRPVDRYTLSDAILAAWHKHGNDSWCSIADEVIAALAAPEAVGVADETAGLVTALLDPYRWTTLNDDHLDRAADLIARYGTAHPAPVPVGERLPGVGDVLHRNGGDWCWGQERSLLTDQAAARWRFMRVSKLQDEAVTWLPHWALPLPEATP